jgi:AraC family ethanolamine operon transcriptional activator
MVTLGMLVTGEAPWRVFGKAAANGDMLLMPEGGEFMINLPPQSLWMALQVPRARLEAAGVPLDGIRGATAWRLGPLNDDDARQQLLELAAALLAADDARQAGAGIDLAHAHEQLLALMLSEWERRRAIRGGHAGERLQPGERWRIVCRAEAYLEGIPEAAVRIDDLCRAACTSLSTLERVFREVFGVTPRRYLALRRLARVRNDLLNGNPAQSVTEVASRWGFFHLGRFAQEYGRLYHERPSETRSRAGA